MFARMMNFWRMSGSYCCSFLGVQHHLCASRSSHLIWPVFYERLNTICLTHANNWDMPPGTGNSGEQASVCIKPSWLNPAKSCDAKTQAFQDTTPRRIRCSTKITKRWAWWQFRWWSSAKKKLWHHFQRTKPTYSLVTNNCRCKTHLSKRDRGISAAEYMREVVGLCHAIAIGRTGPLFVKEDSKLCLEYDI